MIYLKKKLKRNLKKFDTKGLLFKIKYFLVFFLELLLLFIIIFLLIIRCTIAYINTNFLIKRKITVTLDTKKPEESPHKIIKEEEQQEPENQPENNNPSSSNINSNNEQHIVTQTIPQNTPQQPQTQQQPSTSVSGSTANTIPVIPPAPTINTSCNLGGDEYESSVLQKVNDLRVSLGKSCLSWDANLYNFAKVRANEISQNYSHIRPDGSTLATAPIRVKAENIAYGQITSDEIYNDWKNSPPHYQNFIGDYNNNFGVVSSVKVNGIRYWVFLAS